MNSGAGGALAITFLFRKETAVLSQRKPASVLAYVETNLKQIEAQRTRAESTHKGVN